MKRDHIFRNGIFYVADYSWGAFAIGISSGWEDHDPHLSLIGFGYYLSVSMPKWLLSPHRRKVIAETWDAATVARMGRNWYWDETRREFGIGIHENMLSVKYGVQPDSWSGNKTWNCEMPWGRMRFNRHSYYGLFGEHVATMPSAPNKRNNQIDWENRWEYERAIKEAVPRVVFSFDDFDGERIECATLIEEREWLKGARGTAWVSLFTKPLIRRSLDLDFSKPTGPRKGSWKGGVTGCGIDLLPGELHEAAFRRYCGMGPVCARAMLAASEEVQACKSSYGLCE